MNAYVLNVPLMIADVPSGPLALLPERLHAVIGNEFSLSHRNPSAVGHMVTHLPPSIMFSHSNNSPCGSPHQITV